MKSSYRHNVKHSFSLKRIIYKGLYAENGELNFTAFGYVAQTISTFQRKAVPNQCRENPTQSPDALLL